MKHKMYDKSHNLKSDYMKWIKRAEYLENKRYLEPNDGSDDNRHKIPLWKVAEILDMSAEGFSQEEVAEVWGVCDFTVRNYLKRDRRLNDYQNLRKSMTFKNSGLSKKESTDLSERLKSMLLEPCPKTLSEISRLVNLSQKRVQRFAAKHGLLGTYQRNIAQKSHNSTMVPNTSFYDKSADQIPDEIKSIWALIPPEKRVGFAKFLAMFAGFDQVVVDNISKNDKKTMIEMRRKNKTVREISKNTGIGQKRVSKFLKENGFILGGLRPPHRKFNNSDVEKVLQLRSEGKSYYQIEDITEAEGKRVSSTVARKWCMERVFTSGLKYGI